MEERNREEGEELRARSYGAPPSFLPSFPALTRPTMAKDVFTSDVSTIISIMPSKAEKRFPAYRTSTFPNGVSWENMRATITHNEAKVPFFGHENKGRGDRL